MLVNQPNPESACNLVNKLLVVLLQKEINASIQAYLYLPILTKYYDGKKNLRLVQPHQQKLKEGA